VSLPPGPTSAGSLQADQHYKVARTPDSDLDESSDTESVRRRNAAAWAWARSRVTCAEFKVFIAESLSLSFSPRTHGPDRAGS
jgi:hypothetical protein